MINHNTHNNVDTNTLKSDEIEKKELSDDSSLQDNNNETIDPRDSRIIQLEIQLAQLQEQERDTVLRLQAEVENVRRRSTQEIEKIHKFALERFITEILPVIDNLERTLDIVDRSSPMQSSIVEGIELTLKSFLDIVCKFGVESIHEVHVPFDPAVHQAISVMESKKYSNNQVLTIIQKGYILRGRLIRPAMVIVSAVAQDKLESQSKTDVELLSAEKEK